MRRGERFGPSAGRVAAILVGLLSACTSPPSEDSSRPVTGQLRAFYERTAEAGRVAEAGPWRGWYERLAALDADDRATEPIFLRAGSERPVWDDALLGELLRAEPQGPLATISSLARQLESAGVDLLVVPVPPRSVVFPEIAGLPPGVARSPAVGSSLDRAPSDWPPLDWRLRVVYSNLAAQGVEVVDLLETMRAERSGLVEVDTGPPVRQLVFRRQDRHWTPYGAGVVARSLAGRIRRYPWFETARAEEGRALMQVDRRLRSVRGPIAERLAESGALLPGWGPEPVAFLHTRVEGERWSRTARGSPVLLLGDSFSLGNHGLPDALLRELGFRVDLLTVAGGVPSAQLKALRFRGDGLEGKRLVIWEFATASLALAELWEPVEGIVEPLGESAVEKPTGSR